MCTLLLWKSEHPRYPLIAAANRDEYLARAARPPLAIRSNPLVVGGRDVVAGGTWFAVSSRGLLVAVTNRRGAGAHDPAKQSRGALVLDVAGSTDFFEARDGLAHIDASRYNPFILFVGDAREAVVAHGGADGLRLVVVSNGAHAVTNWDLDAHEPPIAARAKRLASSVHFSEEPEDADRIALRLHRMLSDHGGEGSPGDALCVHKPEIGYGTRSSTIVFIGAEPSQTRLFHAEGPPCTAALADVTALLREKAVDAGQVTK